MNLPSADADNALNRRYLRWAFVLNGASLLTTIALYGSFDRNHWFREGATILGAIATGAFVITFPICVLTLIGRPPVMTLAPLIPTRRQRARWREMRQRPDLSDEEFYARFYRHTNVRKDVPLRLRAVYAEAVGIKKVFPEDRAAEFDEEMDFGELLREVADEFEVEFSEQEAQALAADGTFDAVVHNLAQRPISTREDLDLRLADSSMVPEALRSRRKGFGVALLVIGGVVTGSGFLMSRLEVLVPGLVTVIALLGLLMTVAALLRGDFRADC